MALDTKVHMIIVCLRNAVNVWIFILPKSNHPLLISHASHHLFESRIGPSMWPDAVCATWADNSIDINGSPFTVTATVSRTVQVVYARFASRFAAFEFIVERFPNIVFLKATEFRRSSCRLRARRSRAARIRIFWQHERFMANRAIRRNLRAAARSFGNPLSRRRRENQRLAFQPIEQTTGIDRSLRLSGVKAQNEC